MLHLISMGLHAVVSANAPLRDHCLQYRHQQAPPQLPGRSRIFSHDFNSDFLDIAAIYFHQNQVEIDPLIPHRAIAAQRVKLLNHGLFLRVLRHFRRLSGINLHNLRPAALNILWLRRNGLALRARPVPHVSHAIPARSLENDTSR